MRTKIITIGNSKGLRIPKVLLEESGLDGDVEIRASGDGLTVSPLKKPRREVSGLAHLSEQALAKDWDRPDEDVAWRDL